MNVTTLLLPLLVDGADKVPAPEDVKAGWVAFGVFIGLAVAVAVLGVSLTRHLRKVRDNAAKGGVYDESTPRRPADRGFPTHDPADPERPGGAGADGAPRQASAG